MAQKGWFLEGVLTGAILGFCIAALTSKEETKQKKTSVKKQKSSTEINHSKERIFRILDRTLDGVEIGIHRIVDAIENKDLEPPINKDN